MVKLNPTEIQLLTEALFESDLPAQLEDIKDDLDDEKQLEIEDEKSELEETPESHVQFPIRRRRSVVYRRLFCVGLFLVLLSAGLILTAYLLKSNNYVIEIKLEKGHTLTYHLEQEMIFQGSKTEKTTFSEVITAQVVNKTANGHWLRFNISSLPRFNKKNFTFLARVDLDGEKARLDLDTGTERFEIHTNSERNSEFDFYIHNLFNQLLPAVKIDLLDVILSQISTRNREIPVDKAWYLPGRVIMQQHINTNKNQVELVSKITPENFHDFVSSENGLPKLKLEFEETASISKKTGMLLNSDLFVSAKLPLEGADGAIVGVEFKSSIRLAGEQRRSSSDATSEKENGHFVKIPKPSESNNNKPAMHFIPPIYKHAHVEKKDLVTEVKELLNLTTTSEKPKDQVFRKDFASPFFTIVGPADGIRLAVVNPSDHKAMGQRKEALDVDVKNGQGEDGMSNGRQGTMKQQMDDSQREDIDRSDEPGAAYRNWRVYQNGKPYDDEEDDDDEHNQDDDRDEYSDYNQQEMEKERYNDEDYANEETKPRQTKKNVKNPPKTTPPSTTPKPTSAPTTQQTTATHTTITSAVEDDVWSPFSFFQNLWHTLVPNEEEKPEQPSTTQQPTTKPPTTAITTTTTTTESSKSVDANAQSPNNDEETDEWNPFKAFSNLWRRFDSGNNADNGEPKEEDDNNDDDDSFFHFKLPSIFHFPDFTQRKRRSLEPQNKAPVAEVRPGMVTKAAVAEVRPEDRSLRRDRRRLTDDGQDRDDTTTTELDAGDLDKIWDIISDQSLSINNRPRRKTRVFKETVHGVEVVSDLEHEIEVLREVVDMRPKNYWSVRLRLGIEAGGHYLEVFNRVIDVNEIERIFLTKEKPKKEYGIEQGGTLIMCRPLFYVQHFCVSMKFSFSLHLVHAITRLDKEYPTHLTVHFKHLAAVNTVVSSHASTLLNSGGVYGKGALFQAKVPLDLQFSAATKPAWCTRANLRSRIGSFYRKWSGVNQWRCPLDEAVAKETTCAGLERSAHNKEEEPLTSDNAFTKRVHFLDSC